MVILVFSNKCDPHAQTVLSYLDSMGMDTRLASMAQLLQKYQVLVEIAGFGAEFFSQCQFTNPTNSAVENVDLKSISAVWLRRNVAIKPLDGGEEWAAALASNESTKAIGGILRCIECLWVNAPSYDDESTFKIKQLQVARKCGWRVPRTLISNNPCAVKRFYDSCGGQVIYKLIDQSSWKHFPDFEIPKAVATLPLRKQDLDHLDQVRLSLHLFQEHIQKAADIRITVVGSKIFAVRIESQLGKGNIDFRMDYSVPMSIYELPAAVKQKCLSLMSHLGLNFSTIDICLTRDGDYVFLEVNSQGQWLWMEEKLDLPISLEVARLLAGLDPPLVKNEGICRVFVKCCV